MRTGIQTKTDRQTDIQHCYWFDPAAWNQHSVSARCSRLTINEQYACRSCCQYALENLFFSVFFFTLLSQTGYTITSWFKQRPRKSLLMRNFIFWWHYCTSKLFLVLELRFLRFRTYDKTLYCYSETRNIS